VNFSNDGRPHIALSFPKVMPPDSELFICIRTGQCKRIKELLGSGRATVSDIAAPYGLTTLALAIIHGQNDVCQLLIQAGAQQQAPNYIWHIGDIFSFYADFSISTSSLSAGVLLQDFANQFSTESQLKALRSCISISGFEGDDFSRLHKSVLGLTSESVETVARLSRASIDEVDSAGQTALHWAALTGNTSAIDILLRCGADPNIHNSVGATPLHLAAGLGCATSVPALIAAGADIEANDRFGSKPLHYASSQGHIGVMNILLDENANFESTNGVDETPLLYAVFGRRPSAIKTLLDRGANLERESHMGYRAISKAALMDSHEVLETVLAGGAAANCTLFDDKTILHIVALNSDLRTAASFGS
jgi:ankyrin repeat protein